MTHIDSETLVLDRDRNIIHVESDRAEKMFARFVAGDFSYDFLANHPDYLVYASAKTLALLLPLIIGEMLKRRDTINYLIYPILGSLDPRDYSDSVFAKRTKLLSQIASRELIENALALLNEIYKDPPVPIAKIDQIKAYWSAAELKLKG